MGDQTKGGTAVICAVEQIVVDPDEVTPAVTGELTVRFTDAVLVHEPFET